MSDLLATLRRAFHDEQAPEYRPTQLVVGILIALSVLLFVLELSLEGGTAAVRVVQGLDTVVLWLFVIEILARVASYEPPSVAFYADGRGRVLGRIRYCFRPLNLADILAVLAVIPALRGLRALRLLRLLRGVKLFKYSNPVAGVSRALEDNAILYSLAFSFFGGWVLLGGLSFFLVERGHNPDIASLADGFWWSIVTLTTVGFGDISPVTSMGRVVGAVLMVAGMFSLAVFAGIVGHTMLHSVLSFREDQFRMTGYVNHVVICGYDPAADVLLGTLLSELGDTRRHIVIFAPGDRPASLAPEFTWVTGDPEKESELDKVRMSHASACILVGLRDRHPQQADATTILTAFTIRRYLRGHPVEPTRDQPLYIVAEILDQENVEHARAAGCDEVIESTLVGFSLVAHAVAMPGTASVISRVARSGSHSMYVGRMPDGLGDTTFGELVARLKESHDALVIGVRRDGEPEERINPPADTPVAPTDALVYLATGAVLPAAPG